MRKMVFSANKFSAANHSFRQTRGSSIDLRLLKHPRSGDIVNICPTSAGRVRIKKKAERGEKWDLT